MMGDDRKRVLVVEDDCATREFHENKLGAHYDVTFMFYEASSYVPPSGKFDVMIVDSLEGDCWNVARQTYADKKILLSGESFYVQKAPNNGLIGISKGGAHLLERIGEVLGR